MRYTMSPLRNGWVLTNLDVNDSDSPRMTWTMGVADAEGAVWVGEQTEYVLSVAVLAPIILERVPN